MLDTGYWMLDTRYWLLVTKIRYRVEGRRLMAQGVRLKAKDYNKEFSLLKSAIRNPKSQIETIPNPKSIKVTSHWSLGAEGMKHRAWREEQGVQR